MTTMVVRTTSDQSQAFACTGRLLVAATGLRPMTDASCYELVEMMHQATHSDGLVAIQYSPLQSPTTAQRKIFVEGMKDYEVEAFFVLTESQMVRGAVTALAWLQGGRAKSRAFQASDYRAALKQACQLTGCDPAEAQAMLTGVVAAVGLPPLL